MKTFETNIQVEADGNGVSGADVALLATDGTYRAGKTDSSGKLRLELPVDGEERTILIAHPEYKSHHATQSFNAAPHSFVIRRQPKCGSALFLNGSGHVPGLEGRLNPIRDSLNRTYIYGDNLAFEERSEQPYPFQVGQPFTVSDSLRNRYVLIISVIRGRTSLLDYEKV